MITTLSKAQINLAKCKGRLEVAKWYFEESREAYKVERTDINKKILYKAQQMYDSARNDLMRAEKRK